MKCSFGSSPLFCTALLVSTVFPDTISSLPCYPLAPGILDSANGSLVLLERGDVETLPRHPDFRLLASMNPPTDFGKKDLPPSMRGKMTEVWSLLAWMRVQS